MPTLVFGSNVAYDSGFAYDDISIGTPLVQTQFVRLAGLEFDGARDESGVAWFVESLDGWDSVDIRSGSTQGTVCG